MKKTILALTAIVLSTIMTTSFAQTLKTPAASPAQTVTQAFGIGEVKVEYSRPGVKGRVVFGDLVPYGKVWRTGANATTKITLGDDMKINGTPVAGTYGIYTIPNATEWDVMLYKDLTLGGDVGEYKPENELMRFKVKPSAINDKMETFTIAFNDVTFTTCNLDLIWDKTKVSIPLTSDHDSKVMKNIETALSPSDKRPYFAAATYYLDNGKDLNKALEWCNKAIEMNPKAYYMTHVKAKIQMGLKDYKGAMATAELSKATAVAEKDEHYTYLNDKLIADLKKMAK